MPTRHPAAAFPSGLSAGVPAPTRRRLLRGALSLAVLGSVAGAGLPAGAAGRTQPRSAGGFVVVDGWVLPAAYFLD